MVDLVHRKYPAGYCILSGCDIPEHIEIAKEYIKDHDFTHDDIKFVKDGEGGILIVTKREIEL